MHANGRRRRGLLAAVAHAEPAQPVAVSINAPLSWGSAISGSAQARLDDHNAIRGNVAVYDHRASVPFQFWLATQGAGVETDYSGRTIDVGVGWQYFPRRLYDGFVFEAGVIRRIEDHVHDHTSFTSRIDHRRAVGYAARMMFGWSWMLGDRAFIAASLGVSLKGTETEQVVDFDTGEMGPSRLLPVDEDKIEGEAYLRFGIAFGR